LCAGSLLLFSLWAPIFQDKLGYSQLQINGISIAGEIGMYIPYVAPDLNIYTPMSTERSSWLTLCYVCVRGIESPSSAPSATNTALPNSPSCQPRSLAQHTSSPHMHSLTTSPSTSCFSHSCSSAAVHQVCTSLASPPARRTLRAIVEE